MNSKNFFAELKRRNVYKVAVAYAVLAWLLIQVATQVFPFFEIPNWGVRLIVLFIVIGFPIALILAWAFELTPEGIKRAEDVDLSKSITRKTSRKLDFFIIAVLLLIIAILLFQRLHPTVSPAVSSSLEKSIAVLPFENLSADPANAYFADGIQEEILTRLSKIADLKVISRTSTQRFKSAPSNLLEIGRQLGVAHILEGSAQRSADQVRVNVQLVNAATDAHLWAETYDRKLTDIFAVESEIAAKIADVLQAELTGAEQRAIATRPTENSEAHELYLKGRYFFGKRTADDFKRAIDYFNQAIGKDPNYALAYAGLADTYAVSPEYSTTSPAEAFPKATAAAEKALALDNNLAEAHTSLGLLLSNDFNLRESKREFERAIALNPNYAAAHYWLGWTVFNPLGEKDRAIAEFKRAVELDPFSPIINANFGYGLILARRYPEAIAQLRKAIELEPNFFYTHGMIGVALVLNGRIDEGIAEYERAQQLHPDAGALGFLVNAYARKGDRQKALQILEQIKQSSNTPIWAGAVAVGYVGLGDKNEAMNWLERSYAQKEAAIIQIRVNPFLDPLRGDPRFEALAEKIVPAREFEKAQK